MWGSFGGRWIDIRPTLTNKGWTFARPSNEQGKREIMGLSERINPGQEAGSAVGFYRTEAYVV